MCEGELTNLPGIVVSVNEVTQQIKIKGVAENYKDTIDIPAAELRKVMHGLWDAHIYIYMFANIVYIYVQLSLFSM